MHSFFLGGGMGGGWGTKDTVLMAVDNLLENADSGPSELALYATFPRYRTNYRLVKNSCV